MIEFPFVGGTYPNAALPFASQRTVNFFLEADENYKSRVVMEGFPGHQKWTQVGNGPIRGGVIYKRDLIVVSGPEVFKVNTGGGVSRIGSVNPGLDLVSVAENGSQVMIVDGEDGWIWDGTWSKITDSVFTATKADSVTHMDSFFIVNKPGTGSIWVSDSFDGTSWTATRTATAEFKSDPVVGVYSDRELFLGGTFTTQAYYNSGASPMPFEAIRASRLIYGVAAKKSWAIVGNTSYFLAQDENGGVFVGRLNGASVERVSPRAWEKVWSTYGYEDAYAFGVHFHGHEWYIITFPTADHDFGRTFLYSISTNSWSEIGPYQPSVGDFGKHPMRWHGFFSGRNLIGDDNGALHELSSDVFTFNGDTMMSLRRSPVLHDKREAFPLHCLTIDAEVGVDNADDRSPVIHMRPSRDGGYTWRNTRTKSLTSDRKYKTSVDFRQLGMAKDWVFECWISDPVRRRIVGGYVE